MNGQHGYNNSRVRPKRSAVYKYVFSLIKGVTVLWQQGCYFFMVIVTDLNSRSNAKSIIRNFIILHTSFRRMC